MSDYTPPVRDIMFSMFEVFNYEKHFETHLDSLGADKAFVATMLDQFGRFCTDVLSPLNSVGDEQGCKLDSEGVSTPTGFKEAYTAYVKAGWPALAGDPNYGGQGLPESLSIVLTEMRGTANWAWNMYPGLSLGAVNTIKSHGSETQKSLFLTKLIEGTWTGTMCLTESHCGTDLGMLRTKAAPHQDGSYRVSGTKIFISSGDHDLTENIVHIVLARLPDSPPGVK